MARACEGARHTRSATLQPARRPRETAAVGVRTEAAAWAVVCVGVRRRPRARACQRLRGRLGVAGEVVASRRGPPGAPGQAIAREPQGSARGRLSRLPPWLQKPSSAASASMPTPMPAPTPTPTRATLPTLPYPALLSLPLPFLRRTLLRQPSLT